MQSPFPTKKFFIVLLFLVIVAGGTFKLFKFLNSRTTPTVVEEQKLALVQNQVLPSQGNSLPDSQKTEKPVPTSTLNAVAAVAYLNEQTKANGVTMGEITAKLGKQVQDAKTKLDADAYTINDIKTDADNSPETLKKYGNAMAGIFVKYGQEKQANFLVIIKTALETNDPKELKKLDPYITFQKNVIRDALALSVPSSASAVHLYIINASAEMLGVFQNFQAAFDDLPSAVASNSRLVKGSQRFINAMKEADALFKQNGVSFLPEEAGALFASASK